MRNYFFGWPLLILIAAAGCADGDRSVEPQAVAETEAVTATAPNRQCYRNEYPFENLPDDFEGSPDQKDVEWLAIEIDGDHATGEYNWLPAFKDKRIGRFEGSLDGQLVSASYEYTQEGQSSVVPISIRLESEQVVVEGGPPELGLNVTIARVDC